ncbi:MAG: transporter substrate-binding domain-containing protein, partial [Synergistaceae bacterium]|nr:transporter substrate-binding domain-containing protein [Synergistaceae bacterium]
MEELRKKRRSFVYAMDLSTETFYDVNNEIRGYSVLLCDWLGKLFGVPFVPEIRDFKDILAGLESLEVDFTGELALTGEFSKDYFMTNPIAERPIKLMRIMGSEPLSRTALDRPLRYAFRSDRAVYNNISPFIQESFDAVFVNDDADAYRRLKSGDVDALFDDGTREIFFDKFGDVIAEDYFPLIYSRMPLSTKNPELEPIVRIVRRALLSGAKHHFVDLYNLGHQEYLRNKLFSQFTSDELSYINLHTATRSAIPIAAEHDNYPISFYNKQEDEWQGIAFDVLRDVEKLTGLTFERANVEPVDRSKLMDMLEDGTASIITALTSYRVADGRFLNAGSPYHTGYYALLSKLEFGDVKLNEV